MTRQVRVMIDGHEHMVDEGFTVLQACEQAGVEIPRFCYHDRLSIAGNCRMCLVEVKPGSPKLQASCALPVMEGQEITTDSPKVRDGRAGVMEFLLINHPLDCPVCDQGGECDLQDQSMTYGTGKSRFQENKRAVVDKDMGPLIKTVMTRCIHCTRCVRFVSEVAGVDAIGLFNRGEGVEISSLEQAVASELSANVIDLCPVGALTSKPYAFMARPWELTRTESIDVMDATGSNIRIDSRDNQVLRVLPRLHEDINEEWIADKTRYACDGLRFNRLDRPMVRSERGHLEAVSWQVALEAVARKLKAAKPGRMAAIAGDMVDLESLYALKLLLKSLKVAHMDCRQDGSVLGPGQARGVWLFNPTIAGIEEADALLIVGSNPRWEAPLVNARIRKRWLAGHFPVGLVGEKVDLTYDTTHISSGPQGLSALLEGHSFMEVLRRARRPIVLIGSAVSARPDGAAVLGRLGQLGLEIGLVGAHWNGWGMLHHQASRVGGLDVGFVPGRRGLGTAGILERCRQGKMDVLWSLGADELDYEGMDGCCVIYQGHHGDRGAVRADIILPGAAYTEKSGSWVNIEGRVQRSERAVFPPGEAREDWSIIRALSSACGQGLAFDDLESLRRLMGKEFPHLLALDSLPPRATEGLESLVGAGDCEDIDFVNPIGNFYQSDAISRISPTMAACTRALLKSKAQEAQGAEGAQGAGA